MALEWHDLRDKAIRMYGKAASKNRAWDEPVSVVNATRRRKTAYGAPESGDRWVASVVCLLFGALGRSGAVCYSSEGGKVLSQQALHIA